MNYNSDDVITFSFLSLILAVVLMFLINLFVSNWREENTERYKIKMEFDIKEMEYKLPAIEVGQEY